MKDRAVFYRQQSEIALILDRLTLSMIQSVFANQMQHLRPVRLHYPNLDSWRSFNLSCEDPKPNLLQKSIAAKVDIIITL